LRHSERHNIDRSAWLRALVLGANDGIVSIASLVLGVAGASAGGGEVLLAGVAGLVGGALSMAVGEFVSVSSQADLERADIAKETWELAHQPDAEAAELTAIWRRRGLPDALAAEVARALHAHDALGAHLRDELGITDETLARPLQAALASAAAFAVGGALPVGTAALAGDQRIAAVMVACLGTLAALGALSARLGGAPVGRAVGRVVAGGAAAMGLTFGIGTLFGVAV
jgi:VIT1/CCC1 family predicted Fe2+/Mn2+ transporter